ncbi:hypothetical protein Tco_1277344 [Tanacetum coccineum]
MSAMRSGEKNLFRKWEASLKWKKRSLDVSLVAPSACMLSTMLRKSLMWSVLGVGVMFGSVLPDDDATSLKRLVNGLEEPSSGATCHDGKFRMSGKNTRYKEKIDYKKANNQENKILLERIQLFLTLFFDTLVMLNDVRDNPDGITTQSRRGHQLFRRRLHNLVLNYHLSSCPLAILSDFFQN